MAGSAATVEYDDGLDRLGTRGSVRRVIIDWTSDDTTGAVSVAVGKIVGELVKAVTKPSASAAPSDNYDIAITDTDGLNVLSTCEQNLDNRDTANTEVVDLFLLNTDGTPLSMARGPAVIGPLTVAVTNAGNSKQGRLVLYYRP